MLEFQYKASRCDGTIVESRMVSDNESSVRAQLDQQGLLVLSLQSSKTSALGLGRGRFGQRLSLREFLVFNQEFLALIKAGLPILKTFDLLAERATNACFQTSLQGIRREIRGGASISEAMALYPSHFAELYRATLRSGEHTGALADVLQRYITYLKMVIGVREKVVKALAYPVFLIVVGFAVVAFLLVYVMPTFADIYSQSKAELPGPTKLLLSVVQSIDQWLPWALGGLAAAVLTISYWIRTPHGRVQFDRLSLHVPVLGDILRKNAIIRMARTLSAILGGGIPLLNALEITGGAMTNRVVAQALQRTTARVRDGMGLAASLQKERLLPQMMLEMIEVGETTGALEPLLRDVAEFQEAELDLRLNQLTTWIEPVLLLIMGVIVGGLVVVMYLPVFEMAGTV
jgi:type IV pilus assembly protein PilC